VQIVTAIALLLVAAIAVLAIRAGLKLRRSRVLTALPTAPQTAAARPAPLDVGAPYKLVESRHGWMLANPNDTYLGQAILEYGECCENEVGFLLRLIALRPGDVVEVGTNIGTHTVPMAKALAAQGRRLIAFEPQPFIFQNLCANVALNGLSNVTAWPFACGDREATVYFSNPNYLAGDNFGGIEMKAERAPGRVAVPCRRLDEVIDLESIALIKIDVEGFELRALQGAEATLDRHRPLLYVENDRIAESPALVEWLWSKQYRLWWHTPLLFNADNFFGNRNDLYGKIGSFNMLCVPREQGVPVEGLYEVVTGTHPLAQAARPPMPAAS
jgi:FkbM family methyltransferase